MNCKEIIKALDDDNNTDFCQRRSVIIIIENDTIGDKTWNPHIVQTLRDYAEYFEITRGAGNFPQCFKSSNGNRLTVHAGTCCEEPTLETNLEKLLGYLRRCKKPLPDAKVNTPVKYPGHEIPDKGHSFTDEMETLQGQSLEKNLKHLSAPVVLTGNGVSQSAL